MKHHFQNQVSSFADEGKSVRQTTLRSGPCWIKGSRAGVPGFLQLLSATGNSCQLQGRFFIAHSQPDSSFAARCCIRHPCERPKRAAGDVFCGVLGCVAHHHVPRVGSAQVPPVQPLCAFAKWEDKGKGRPLGRDLSLAASQCFPWQNPIPDMDAPSCPMCATHFQNQRGA